MSSIRPTISVRSGRQNEPIRVPFAPLLVDPLAYTFLTSDTASGSGTLTVKNITGFAVNQVLLIGSQGNQGSELIKTHASTAPSGSTITLASNTLYPHSSGTPVYVIAFDQVEVSNATTLAGSKSVLNTQTMWADYPETVYNNTTASTGFYFARFKNTISTTFSDYSDGMPVNGYTMLSARKIIDNSLKALNKENSTNILTDEFCFNEINNCQYEVLREYKRWSFMQQFNYIMGQATTGGWAVPLPATVDDQNTNKSIYNFRIGTESNMTWVDKEKWDDIIEFTAHTTLANNVNVNDSTITLTSANDFSATGGTISIGANMYTYTSKSGNVLTLQSVSTTTNTAGQDVFQGASLGDPQYWTTYGGTIYHYPIAGSEWGGLNYYLDFYQSLTQIQNDTDTIVLPDPTLVQYYLMWKMLLRLNNGEETQASLAQFGNYQARKQNLKMKETIGTSYTLKPRINDFARQMRGLDDQDSKFIRDGNFPNI